MPFTRRPHIQYTPELAAFVAEHMKKGDSRIEVASAVVNRFGRRFNIHDPA